VSSDGGEEHALLVSEIVPR